MKAMVSCWRKDPTGDRLVTCHHPLHLPQCPCLHHHHYYHHYILHLNPNNLFLCQTNPGCTRSLLKTEPGTIMLQASQGSYRFLSKMIKAWVDCIEKGFEPLQAAWRGGKDNQAVFAPRRCPHLQQVPGSQVFIGPKSDHYLPLSLTTWPLKMS